MIVQLPAAQNALFYDFCIEKHIPSDYLLCQINKFLDFAIDASFIRADVSRQRSENSPVDWIPAKTESRAVKEYLEELDQNASLQRPQKSVSLTDPMAQWSGAKDPAEFYYSTNYMIDIEKISSLMLRPHQAQSSWKLLQQRQ